jgi:hypothetical protein
VCIWYYPLFVTFYFRRGKTLQRSTNQKNVFGEEGKRPCLGHVRPHFGAVGAPRRPFYLPHWPPSVPFYRAAAKLFSIIRIFPFFEANDARSEKLETGVMKQRNKEERQRRRSIPQCGRRQGLQHPTGGGYHLSSRPVLPGEAA